MRQFGKLGTERLTQQEPTLIIIKLIFIKFKQIIHPLLLVSFLLVTFSLLLNLFWLVKKTKESMDKSFYD